MSIFTLSGVVPYFAHIASQTSLAILSFQTSFSSESSIMVNTWAMIWALCWWYSSQHFSAFSKASSPSSEVMWESRYVRISFRILIIPFRCHLTPSFNANVVIICILQVTQFDLSWVSLGVMKDFSLLLDAALSVGPITWRGYMLDNISVNRKFTEDGIAKYLNNS